MNKIVHFFCQKRNEPTEAIAEIMNSIENIKLVNKEIWPLKRRRRLSNAPRRGSTLSTLFARKFFFDNLQIRINFNGICEFVVPPR